MQIIRPLFAWKRKLFRKATGYEQRKAELRLRELSLQSPFEHSVTPQIPLTRPIFRGTGSAV